MPKAKFDKKKRYVRPCRPFKPLRGKRWKDRRSAQSIQSNGNNSTISREVVHKEKKKISLSIISIKTKEKNSDTIESPRAKLLRLDSPSGSDNVAETNQSTVLPGSSEKRMKLDTVAEPTIIKEEKDDYFPPLSFIKVETPPTTESFEIESTFEDDNVISGWCDLLTVKLKKMDAYTREQVMNQIDNYISQVMAQQENHAEERKSDNSFVDSCSSNLVSQDMPSCSGISSSVASVGENLTTNDFYSMVKVKEEEIEINEDIKPFLLDCDNCND